MRCTMMKIKIIETTCFHIYFLSFVLKREGQNVNGLFLGGECLVKEYLLCPFEVVFLSVKLSIDTIHICSKTILNL